MSNKQHLPGSEASPSRRAVLRLAALAPVVTIVPLRFMPDAIREASAASPAYASPPEVFFTPTERAFVDAAVSRLIPADDLGPGAKEAGVTDFIDHQLAGPYGRGESWYMQGPWQKGTEEQGYQSRLAPGQIYRVAIAAIDALTTQRHRKPFAELDAATQDAFLTEIEKSDQSLTGIPAKTFFGMLLQNTIEGFLADPIYGGNRDFIGWKLIGFPGPRYNYLAEIDQHGRKYDMPFVSIGGATTASRG